MTLWRPDNSGYCLGLDTAGKYEKVIPDYHDTETNQPIPIDSGAVMLDYGMMEGGEIGILNNENNRNLLGLEYHRGNMKKIEQKKY